MRGPECSQNVRVISTSCLMRFRRNGIGLSISTTMRKKLPHRLVSGNRKGVRTRFWRLQVLSNAWSLSAMSVLICPWYVQFKILILAPIDTNFEQEYNPVAFIENGQELVTLPGEYYFQNIPHQTLLQVNLLHNSQPFQHLVSYDRYFKSKLNEYIIENFEWGLNVQLREHCATSVKTKFSRSITQILPFCDNFYTYRCGFSMQTKRFYFHWKRVETGDDILQIL